MQWTVVLQATWPLTTGSWASCVDSFNRSTGSHSQCTDSQCTMQIIWILDLMSNDSCPWHVHTQRIQQQCLESKEKEFLAGTCSIECIAFAMAIPLRLYHRFLFGQLFFFSSIVTRIPHPEKWQEYKNQWSYEEWQDCVDLLKKELTSKSFT